MLRACLGESGNHEQRVARVALHPRQERTERANELCDSLARRVGVEIADEGAAVRPRAARVA
jgi:hypothetical protein